MDVGIMTRMNAAQRLRRMAAMVYIVTYALADLTMQAKKASEAWQKFEAALEEARGDE